MATSENLGLYLPTRDDYISVKRDISDNMEIIDAAVGQNITDITKLKNVDESADTIVQNITGVKNALLNFASQMSEGDSKLVRIVHTDTGDTSIMRPSVRYAGYLTKNYANGFSWLASGYLEKEPVIFTYFSDSQYWVVDKIALNSNLGLATKSIIIGSGWSLSSAIVNELGSGRVRGIVAFTCTGNLPTDIAGYGMGTYGNGYVVCNDYYQALWYSDTNGGIFTGYKVYSDTAWSKVQRIDNSIREYSMSASAEIPTTTELHNFFENTSVSDGTYVVSISTSSGVRSALIYTQASRKYGAGLLISYYNSSWYKVKNTNGTVTITAF